jgi:hypothetical protein
MEKINLLKSLGASFKLNRKGLFRLWLILLGVHLISLLMGFAIFLITFGIQFALRKIVIYWTPARYWLVKTFDLTIPEPDTSKVSQSHKTFVDVFHFVILLLYIFMGFYLVKLGIDILGRDGFLNQNFIYLVFFRK